MGPFLFVYMMIGLLFPLSLLSPAKIDRTKRELTGISDLNLWIGIWIAAVAWPILWLIIRVFGKKL